MPKRPGEPDRSHADITKIKKKLTKEMGKWAKYARDEMKKGNKRPDIPQYIAESILLICTNMSYKKSFIGYPFKEDMIGDAIENCVRYLHNFDVDVSENAFGYLSQFAYYAFLNRIKKEKKRHNEHLRYIHKLLTDNDFDDILSVDDPDDVEHHVAFIEHMQSILDDMEIDLDDDIKKTKKRKDKSMEILKGEEY